MSDERTESCCTPTERKLLDRVATADVLLIIADGGFTDAGDGPQAICWFRNLSQPIPHNFTIDYGHLPSEDGEKWGQRVVRRVRVTMGLTAKQFDAAVKRSSESEQESAA